MFTLFLLQYPSSPSSSSWYFEQQNNCPFKFIRKKKQKSSFIIIIIIHYPYNSCILNNKNNDNNNKKNFKVIHFPIVVLIFLYDDCVCVVHTLSIGLLIEKHLYWITRYRIIFCPILSKKKQFLFINFFFVFVFWIPI